MSISETGVCNQALARIGAARINDLATDNSVNAIHCRTHYEPTRDALLRSFWWRFASSRATLSVSSETPDFEWDYQYPLPNDFLANKSIYESGTLEGKENTYYTIEGDMLLTNESEMSIRYIKKVIDPAQFDPLFVEVLVLWLALKLVMPITQDKVLRREISDELKSLMARARAVSRQEANTSGRSDWNLARFGSGIV